MTEPSFRAASLADLPKIVELLTASGLPVEGVEAHIDSFLLAFLDGSLAACAGLERYGPAALLRSVAAAKPHRRKGLGQRLVTQLIAIAPDDGIESLLLLTTTAAGYFERFGFQTISRAEAPAAVQYSVEFQGVCPASAAVMRLDIRRAESIHKGSGSTQSRAANHQSKET
jgi:amino-acid N-acetyltransferase